ncbi:MAG: GUN4 domain-containing protein [Scytolyngbya sp. HA4215-MV1]|jgi:hypothetical protein|nr:GUN4 domain-containing protein [Scytolyngbya sp. HA4215-MV1]
MTTSAPDTSNPLTDLRTKLWSEPENKQLPLIEAAIGLGETGLDLLTEFLLAHPQPTCATGKAYQALLAVDSAKTNEFLQRHFPEGVVPLRSAQNVDYAPLQKLLAQRYFQTADQMTLHKLCELAGTDAVQRRWLYFTEIEPLPNLDLQTINTLWLVYSEGRFGFSVQRDLWLSLGKNWERLWAQIGWKSGNNWTRYPQEFTWDLSAPKGHLPLSNQLRGVRVIDALLNHPVWSEG